MVRSRPLDDTIVLMIADTGIGIAPHSLARLGRPFEQVESQLTKTYHGSGLGLAIARSLAQLHGGSMRLRSKLGAAPWSACRCRAMRSRRRPGYRPRPEPYDCSVGATSRATLTSAAISGVIGSRCGITMPML